MKKIFIIAAVFSSFLSRGICQSNIYVGINAVPSLTFPQSAQSFIHLNEEVNYSLGFDVLLFLNTQFFLKSGINYTQKSFSLSGIPDTRGTLVNDEGVVIYDINNPGAFLDISRIRMLEITERFYSITVPVILNCKFSEEARETFFVSGGFEAAYLYNIKGYISTEENEKDTWNAKMNDWTASITAGFGWYQPLSERFLLIINPKYSYDFYPDWNRETFNFHTLSLSIECYFH